MPLGAARTAAAGRLTLWRLLRRAQLDAADGATSMALFCPRKPCLTRIPGFELLPSDFHGFRGLEGCRSVSR
jgi:hypothetical protein